MTNDPNKNGAASEVPTDVPAPICHSTGQSAEVLKTAIPNMFRMFRGAPTYRDDGVFDISETVEIDENGKLSSKPE